MDQYTWLIHSIQAKSDLVSAYNDAAGRTPVTRISTELGGTTLTPGIYDSADGTFKITGTLTLDAKGDSDGVFIFITDSTLITASDSRVNLINNARYCRTFWKVGSSATLGTNSHFVGHIFALTSITANTGATIQGQLLARNGAVTLDTNTITNGICEIAPTPVNQTTLINVTKTPDPLVLAVGPGPITYTYKETNPGTVALSNVSVLDDKVSSVNYVSGDVNTDNLLQPDESWIYTGKMNLDATTTNTATAKGIANGIKTTDMASSTVSVKTPAVVTTMVTGGQLPKNSLSVSF
ncbi:MAG: ice-binding family protein [Clostridiaceae bacterium]